MNIKNVYNILGAEESVESNTEATTMSDTKVLIIIFRSYFKKILAGHRIRVVRTLIYIKEFYINK